MTSESEARVRQGLTRRGALGALGGTLGVGLAAGGYALGQQTSAGKPSTIPFFGTHQTGIATPAQAHLSFAAFDLTAETMSDLQQLLRSWSSAAAQLCSDRPANAASSGGTSREDPGEAHGLAPASLTITLGLGATLFDRDGEDRLGLGAQRPPALAPLPPLPGDELQAARSNGDLCIQACADDAQVAFHAIHALALAAHGAATPRWAQSGFLPTRATQRLPGAQRNLMGFKDGTNNVRGDDEQAMRRHVWVRAGTARSWMRNGTYLVARRIRMLLDVWDGLTVQQQEQIIGRHKSTGAPLQSDAETDKVDLVSLRGGGPIIPADAHIRLAAAQTNDGNQILRRGYSYHDGIDQTTGQIDAGLFFICFQRDPQQFAAIQTRLGVHDALAKHISHTSSAVFACPPGTRPSGYIGETLFGQH